MSVRKWLNENRGLAIGIVALIIIISGWLIVRQSMTLFDDGVPGGAYYTVDDGQTWFKGDINQPTPFQHDGKEAVQAHVFECNGKKFVAYMTRHAPQAREAIEKFNAARSEGKKIDAELARGMAFAGMAGKEYKAPGGTKWLTQGNSAEVSKLTTPACDEGQASRVVP